LNVHPLPGDVAVAWTEQPTNVDLFLMGIPYWTSHRIHYDETWARSEGYDGPVVTGVLMYGWIERELVRWAGSPTAVVSYQFRHVGLTCAGEQVQCALTIANDQAGLLPQQLKVLISVTKSDGTGVLTGHAIVRSPAAR
jgi:hydroxyacyl-ACP dehydratase HTD2-like protein with hotdog domain